MANTDIPGRLAVSMPRLSRYGGAESFAWRLSEALAARGHDVDFICARCETDPPDGVNPVVLGRFGGIRLIKILWFAYAAEKARKNGGYDLVFGMGKTINQDILRIGGGPISKFWELSQRAWPEGFARSFKMLRRRMAPANWAIHLIDSIRMKRTPRIVAVSHLVRDWMVEAHPFLDKNAIDVVYNRPDLTRFSPIGDQERIRLRAASGITEDQVVIATAATNFALKGVRHLVSMLDLLPSNYVLHVAGGRNAAKYLRQARELGVEDRVRFLGRVDDMAAFYRAADIFILATFYDACSNAVLEALACGCKAVSSSLNGSAYFLPPRWVFPDPSDVGALADLIRRVAREDRPGLFQWPEDIASGLEPYVEMVERALASR
ncbi:MULTISPECIES: glycosyltransferase family 4 protein [unclassified Pseudodesulfovibrio]|uniref:glycosyltransferase family 4 protein n=1 Tax=unclassified Pseudodesulfovibrio TaxID=2661612 RepID=UPI000FEBBA27|nr:MULTISPECIES: glycosyltransferase family 4 protein [unclassified Pseudodesulfovibrio]MCJ2164229.1 glycosyltransferase family 4 protein [Pseudodesulfovibrio sp. S3-i]RWU05147.1 glycosyltransferase [Pseudodesulfovibrio sp. S3]